MADNGAAIKGIGIAVTADASQIKRVFNEAIQGFENRTIEIKLVAKEDGSFKRFFGAIRGQTVEIGVKLQPTRQSVRDFRKDFNERLAKEHGVQAPISIKPLTQKEGRDLKRQIVESIGQVPIDVVLNWKWGPNGPPPKSFGGGVGGPPAGGGFGTEARGPVAAPTNQNVDAFIRAEVARRMATQQGGPQGAGTGSFSRAPNRPQPPVEEVAAVQPPKTPRKPRQLRQFDKQVGESEEAWTTRLADERVKTLAKLTSTSEEVRRRANNRLVQLDKRMGVDEGRQHQTVPGRTVVTREGKVSTLAPAAEAPGPVRLAPTPTTARSLGGVRVPGEGPAPVVGPLLSDAIAQVFKGGGVTPGTPAAERAKLQQEMGIKVGAGGVTDLGRLAKELGITSASGQNKLIERLNNRLFDNEGRDKQRAPGVEMIERDLADFRRARTDMEKTLKRPQASSRYRDVVAGIDELEKRLAEIAKPEGALGVGKVSRSVFSGQEAQLQYIGTPGPSSRRLQPQQAQIVEQGGALGAFVEEMLSGKRGNFVNDMGAYGDFVNSSTGPSLEHGTGTIRDRYVNPETGKPYSADERRQMEQQRVDRVFGEGYRRADELRQAGQPVRALFGDTRYNEETGRFEPVPPGEKLPGGETSTGFRGALPLRADLDAAARAGHLPGVGRGAARYAQAETRDDLREGKFTEQGLDYITKRDALTAIIQGVRVAQTSAQEDLSRKLSAQRSAETTAEAVNPPQRPLVRQRQPDETMEAFRSRREETLKPFNEAKKRFDDRVKAREERDAELERAAVERKAEGQRRDPMRGEFRESEESVKKARSALTAARRSTTQVVDTDLRKYLERQRGGKGPTNLDRLRSLVMTLKGASDEQVPELLGDARTVGKPPKGFNEILGSVAAIESRFDRGTKTAPNAFFSPTKGRAKIADFERRLAGGPESIATSPTGPPDAALIARREAELREARIQRVTVGRQRLRARRAAATSRQIDPETGYEVDPNYDPNDELPTTRRGWNQKGRREAGPELPDMSDLGFSPERVMAAFGHGPQQAQAAAGGFEAPPPPPGATYGGGGGLEHGGGVVPVRVMNFAELKGEGGSFASGPAAGVPPSADMLKMFQTATSGGFEEAMQKLGWKPREEAEPEPVAAKNPDDVFERGGTAAGSLRTAVNMAGRLGLRPIPAERLAEITEQSGMNRVRGLVTPGDDTSRRLEESAERARVGVEVSPARAVATATGQIFANLPFIGGRSKMLERSREAGAATAVARSLGSQKAELEAAMTVLKEYLAQLPEGSKRHKEFAKSVDATSERLGHVAAAEKKAAEKAIDLNNGVAKAGDVMRSFGAGVLGTITGQILFQGVFGAAQGIVQAGTAALGPVAERMSGYRGATAAVTTGLAAQTAQTGTPTKTLVEQQLAAANLSKQSAGRIDQTIADRAEVMAGNKQIEEQTKLFAAASNIQQQNRTGLGDRGNGRYRSGSDVNMYESTGGFADTSFLAPQQSTQESLGNLFSDAGRTMAEQLRAEAPPKPVANQLFPTQTDQDILSAIGDAFGAGSTTAGLSGRENLQLPDTLKGFDDSLKAANQSLSLHVAKTDKDTEQVEVFAKALEGADMQSFADGVRKAGVYVEGLGALKTPEARQGAVTQAADNYMRGAAIRDPGQIVAAMGDQVRATVEGSLKQGQLEREQIIPAQRDLANLANPVVPLSGQDIIGSPAQGGGFFGDLTGAMGGRAGITPGAQPQLQRASIATLGAQQAQAQNEQQAREGIDKLFKPFGDSFKNEYLAVRSEIGDIGKQLAGLQQEQVNIQIKLSTQQFDEQLRQVRRGLADAQELTTGVDQPGNTDNVGLLERRQLMLSRSSAEVGFQQQQLGLQSQALALQNQLLGRRSQALSFQSNELSFQSKQLGFQSQALSLAQNQRQINFQVASAGFTAPGLTPEERAARIAEAKAEANVAQQQQDISVKQFGIEQQQFGIEVQQFGIAKAQYELDAQNIAIQQAALALAQQQYGLSVAQYNTQQQLIDAQNARTVTDLKIQEGLIEAAKTAQQQLALNEKTIDSLTRKMQAEMEMASSYLQQASGVATQINQTSASLIAQFGGDLNKIVTAYGEAWANFRQIATGGGGTAEPAVPHGFGARYASGAIGMVSSPTNMVVGDAGGEMVAILRNPKPVALGAAASGGGGIYAPISLTFTGNSVRNDDDLEKLAAIVSRKVEESLGRRASQLGFRAVR